MMWFNFIISIAARCSDVWGCGHDSLPARYDHKLVSQQCCNIKQINFYVITVLHTRILYIITD